MQYVPMIGGPGLTGYEATEALEKYVDFWREAPGFLFVLRVYDGSRSRGWYDPYLAEVTFGILS